MCKNICLFLVCFPLFLLSQNKVSLEFDQIRFDELTVGGFSLESDRAIQIKAIGAGLPGVKKRGTTAKFYGDMAYDPNGMFVYAWIIDAASRELVWRMGLENTRRESWSNDYLREFNEAVPLARGRYELYFWAMKPPKILLREDGLPSLGRLFQSLIKGDRWLEEIEEACRIQVDDVDEIYSATEVRQYQKARLGSGVVSLIAGGDYETLQEFITLKDAGEFEIYAVGEAFMDEEYDYGWIEKIDDNQKIWEAQDEYGQLAGGAQKNKVWKTRLKLPAGDYSIHFITDDSHSPESWNANPPYDPFSWGITLSGVQGKFNPADIQHIEQPEAVSFLRMTRIGDDRRVQQGFRLKKATRIRVYAVGEGFPEGMADYGWIVDSRTGERVWEMRYEHTRHAGGAQKNRYSDEIITLPPGDYWVYFQTDDSHAYRDWNSKPPRTPADWGITLFLVDEVSIEDITIIDEGAQKPLISLTRIGDNEHVQKQFEVSKTTRLKIRAVGEGDDGEMFDYGWIEDAQTGKIVWRMEYDKTVHAGGASKNRMTEEMIVLKKGVYNLFYQSDDTHSYRNWNDDPPYHPEAWGISLFPIGADEESVQPVEARQAENPPFINFQQVGDNQLLSKAFRLKRDANVRIVALGEGRDGEMFDYGWIINTQTGRKIWSMKFQKTRSAGGARKNRRIDEVIHLPAGTYMAYFRTDDSHSFPRWNSRPPRHPEMWGMQVSFAEDNFPLNQFEVYDDRAQNEQILSQITGMDDSQHIIERFSLDKETTVRVYAIGEGITGEMVDYGWIENARNNEVLWIMQYEATHRAGGSYKNRSETAILTLPAGEYRVHFVTDDSHSPAHWNASPPEDQENYGITVFRVDR